MRNKQLLRYSLASLTLLGAGLGTFLIACGDDDSTSTPVKTDSGTPDASSTSDSGSDSGGQPEAGPPAPPNAKLQLVNAATDFGSATAIGALRVCYGVGPDEATASAPDKIAPLPPLPDRKGSDAQPFAGVFIGTGGNVQGTGADLTDLVLVPYIMNAESLAKKGLTKPDAGPGTSCGDILGAADAGAGMTPGIDYWKLPAIPAKTFLKGKSYILVLTGCASDATAGVAKCGADFTPGAGPGNGNLKVTVHEVDRATAVGADKIGTQFIHASAAGASYLAALPGGGLAVIPGYVSDPGNPGTFKGVAGDAGVTYNAQTPLVEVTGVNVGSDSFTANPNVAALAIPLPLIQQLSYGANVPDGGAYRNGAAFTFIALGDPTEDADAGGTFNTRKFHYIALPNDPVSEVYKP